MGLTFPRITISHFIHEVTNLQVVSFELVMNKTSKVKKLYIDVALMPILFLWRC